MNSKVISFTAFFIGITAIIGAQSITGTYQLHSLRVVYRNHIRPATHTNDKNINGLYSTWVVPSGDSYLVVDADLDGNADFKRVLQGGHLGAPIKMESFREARDPYRLINDLEINLTISVDMANGVATIPGDPMKTTNKFLFNINENCVNQLKITSFSDSLLINFSEPLSFKNGNTVWGFGILKSSIIDMFKPMNPKIHYLTREDHPPFPSAPDSSWGMIVGREAVNNEDGTQRYKRVDIRWHALDGNYETGGSNSGIDKDGKLNRQLGLSITADNVTIPWMKAWGAQTGARIDIGNYPMIEGKGFDHDKLSFTPAQQLLTHTSVDGTWDGVGYIFDVWGSDGIPFSGDEPFQFTGYYITANFITAASAFRSGLDKAFADDQIDSKAALTAAAKAVAEIFGIDSSTSAAIGKAVAEVLYTDYSVIVETLVISGMDPIQAAETALRHMEPRSTAEILGALKKVGIAVNDGTHDFDISNPKNGGRLLMQVDAEISGGICVPVTQTRDVFTQFTNVEDWVSPEAPIKPLTIISDETSLPAKYALHNNYPNPFNPVTRIGFDLPEDIHTQVAIYNIMGQKVRILHSGVLTAGYHQIFFDGLDDNYHPLSSGVYFYQVFTEKFFAVKKMTLIQ